MSEAIRSKRIYASRACTVAALLFAIVFCSVSLPGQNATGNISGTVTDASGVEVSQGKAQVTGNTMRIGLKPLNVGVYNVNWRAVSTDTHKTEGSFTFQIIQ